MSNNQRIAVLDGWRGVAISLVLIDHLGELSHNAWLHKVTRVGATGVGLFFALSGFLITSILLAEWDKAGRINLRNFYVRRVFRILPPVFAFLGVLFCLREFRILAVTNLQLISSVFLFRNYIPSDWGSGWYTGHLWSLMVEEHFYLLWPAILIWSRRSIRIPLILAVLDAGWRAVAFHYHVLAHVWPPGRTDIRIDSLLWGCIFALLLAQPDMRVRIQRWLTLPVLTGLLAIDAVSNIVHGQHDYSAYEPFILAVLLVYPVVAGKGLLHRVLGWAPLDALGRVSYSVYLWQQFWLLFPGAPAPFPALQRAPWNVGMALLCGVLSYKFVEQPAIRLGRRLIASRAPKLQELETAAAPP